MKYIVVLCDGAADRPNDKLGGKTPLEVANKPHIDSLAKRGLCGMVKTVPQGMKPGSDVANLSVMGYDPLKYYTGRSPLEALSIGVPMADDDLAVRCNLVTLSDEADYSEKTMLDYSAGEISTGEAAELIKAVEEGLGDDIFKFYSGVSYRHCLLAKHSKIGTSYTPPHDITNKVVGEYLPTGLYGEKMLDLMKKSWDILVNHPVNQKRVAEGKNPANSIWLWGEGTKPMLPSFKDTYGKDGAVISAVDLLKGIGIAGGMEIIEVEGVTGTIHTNFSGKAKACVEAIKAGRDYVYLHMEATDECGHQGDVEGKVKSLELIDEIVVKYILEELKDEELTILVAPDHPTPLDIRTHSADPVPFVIYNSTKEYDGIESYTEKNCEATGLFVESGVALAEMFFSQVEATDEVCADIVPVVAEDSQKANDKVEEITEEIEGFTPVDDDEEFETSAEENSKKEDKKSKKKVKKQLSPEKQKKKKKAIIIGIIAIVLVLAITASVLTPILIINQPKQFISKVEDFSKEVKDYKEYYVLNKDITVDGDLNLGMGINLNGKSLIVNGTLTIDNTREGDINIATYKGKEYVDAGSVIADKVIFKDSETVNVVSSLTVDTFEMANIKNLNATGRVEVKNILDIASSTVTFANVVANADTDVKISNFAKVTFQSDLGAEANIMTGASVIAEHNIGNVTLDNTSELRVSGSVYADWTTQELGAITGGKLVYMREGSKAGKVEGTITLWMDKDCVREIIGDVDVKYIKWLDTPADATVSVNGGIVEANVPAVANATRIRFSIDGTDKYIDRDINETNIYDITEIVGKVGSYTIKIVMLADDADMEFIRPSDPLYVEYSHSITLDKVSGANVIKNADGEYILSFNAVDFANSYLVTFDNYTFRIDSEAKAGEPVTYSLTKDEKANALLTVGRHTVKVIAQNTADTNIHDSGVMIATFPPITGVVGDFTAEYKVNIENSSIDISWTAAENASRYEVYIDGELFVNTNDLKTVIEIPVEYIDGVVGSEIKIIAINTTGLYESKEVFAEYKTA